MQPLPHAPFHLAVPVRDLARAEAFYAGLLGCPIGRRAERWIDFDLGGHQISVHRVDSEQAFVASNEVDGDDVPTRHFGLVLPWEHWEALAARLAAAGQTFRIEPHVRFRGEVGEQGTFFIEDGNGNALEFKSFRDPARLFQSKA